GIRSLPPFELEARRVNRFEVRARDEHVVRGERLAEVNDRRGALVVVVVADLTLMVTLEVDAAARTRNLLIFALFFPLASPRPAPLVSLPACHAGRAGAVAAVSAGPMPER